jgi:hypothetical protein
MFSTLPYTQMRISSLIENEAIDTRSAAQRAVHNVVCALKSGNAAESGASDNGSAVSSWLTRISYLDKEISKQQGLLNKLTQGSRGVISKWVSLHLEQHRCTMVLQL